MLEEREMQTKFAGKRNKRGDWRPEKPLEPVRVFWPFDPTGVAKWFAGYPSYLFPWGIFYMAIPIFTWLYLTPALETMQTFAVGWIAFILVRNLVMILAYAGIWHYWLYVKRAQGTDYKYTDKWLARDNPIFMFRNQFLDNTFWTVISAVPIWTAWEVVTWWLFANHYIYYVDASAHPIYFVVMMLLIPIVREVHFYWIHRLIHWGPLYKWVHYLHHNNVNIGPFAGLSMHPVEHLIYFSGVIMHWIIPSHPIHAMFHLQHAAFTPIQSHSGFSKVVMHEGVEVDTGDFFHYLHHRHFECNYGGDGPVMLDKVFGTFHDGTDAATEAMNERFYARAQQKEDALR